MNIRRLPLLLLLLGALLAAPSAGAHPASGPAPRPARLLILGDSITWAGGWVEFVSTWLHLRDPGNVPDILNLGLPSETVSGLSEPGHAGGQFPRPDLHERLGRILEAVRPDRVIACYGMNDGIYHPPDPGRTARFHAGMERLRDQVLAAGAGFLVLTPPVFDPGPIRDRLLPDGLDAYPQPYAGYDDVLAGYASWLNGRRADGWQVVDVHGPMHRWLGERRSREPGFHLAGDGIHPGEQGHWLIAREVLRELGAPADVVDDDTPATLLARHPRTGEVRRLAARQLGIRRDAWLRHTRHLRPGLPEGLPLDVAERQAADLGSELRIQAAPFPGKVSDWHGFPRYDFEIDGHPGTIVAPFAPAAGRPWVWHGEFFGHRPAPDLALLGRGFHAAYLSIPDRLGSPEAVRLWDRFHTFLTGPMGLGPRPGLVGLSRGGLYAYNWGIANPSKVACIYGDAPVCDFKSWPGGKGRGPGSPRDWALVLEKYGFDDEAAALAYPGNPVDNLAPLARAGVPLLHVFGDADEVVPWEENTGLVAERYRALGGAITLIRKPGVRHHPHGLDDSTPIVEFLWRHAGPGSSDPGPRDFEGRPLIRKLGTVDLDLVETTPVVFRGRPWRFEWVRWWEDGPSRYWDNRRRTNHFRFRDPVTGEVTPAFADGHEFGSAYVDGDTMVVTGTQGRSAIHLFTSRDLVRWEQREVVVDPRYGIFNTSLCRAGDGYVLMFEIDRPAEEAGVAFTARFLRSPDLRTWNLTPPECRHAPDRYAAPHALRWHDGWFYNFYLEAHQGYEMRVVRSRDLITWESSPLNPVLRVTAADRLVANPTLTPEQRERIARADNRNNSDLDFCEWQGRLVMTYSWGNQLGIEHLATAEYDGTEAQFLKGWFPEPIRRGGGR